VDKNILIQIHNAIHDPGCPGITINEQYYPVTLTDNDNLRQLKYQNIKFVEQNPWKEKSKWAGLARTGMKITWGIRHGDWYQIVDGEVKSNTE
jgi:hypothetical protein